MEDVGVGDLEEFEGVRNLPGSRLRGSWWASGRSSNVTLFLRNPNIQRRFAHIQETVSPEFPAFFGDCL